MKIVYIISNFICSAVSLLFLGGIYAEYFGVDLLPGFLQTVLGTGIELIFSEYNIIGLLIIYGISILFVIMTVVLLIKNLIQKQNVISFVLSAISIISMIVFVVLAVPVGNYPTLYSLIKWICLFTVVIITVQFIAVLVNTIKSYRLEEN